MRPFVLHNIYRSWSATRLAAKAARCGARSTCISVLLGFTLPFTAAAQADATSLEAQMKICANLALSGDTQGAQTCQQQMIDRVNASMREDLGKVQQENQTIENAAQQARMLECAQATHPKGSAAEAACEQKVLNAAKARLPAETQRMIQEGQRQRMAKKKAKQSTQAARQAVEDSHQQALNCITFNSYGINSGQTSYSYAVTSSCDQPVTVRLCFADGPNQPSRTREARLQPGESVPWAFSKRDHYSPLVTYDACFQAEQCKQQPREIACADA